MESWDALLEVLENRRDLLGEETKEEDRTSMLDGDIT